MSDSKKYDQGKLRWDLLPLNLIEKVVEIYTFGAEKYGANTWQNLEDGYNRYKAAMFRHLMEFEKGNVIDDDSGKEHLAHMVWNAIAMLHLSNDNKKVTFDIKCDDKASSMLKDLKRKTNRTLKPIDEDYSMDLLLYIRKADGDEYLFRNRGGSKMFSLKFGYFVSDAIESLSQWGNVIVRPATESEHVMYERYFIDDIYRK